LTTVSNLGSLTAERRKPTMSASPWIAVHSGNLTEATFLVDLLRRESISAQLGDEVMGTLAPYLVDGGSLSAVKVLVPEEEAEHAMSVIAEFTAGGPSLSTQLPAWKCRRCGEQNESQFAVCWQCQSPRE
jgi:hypothetical protein